MDIVLAFLLLISLWKGWKSGALSMLLSVVLLVVAGVVASSLATPVGNALRIGPSYSRPVIGFFFTFIAFLIAGGFLRRLIKPKQGVLRGIDGLLGAALGLLRGVLVLSFVLLLLKVVNLPPKSMREGSRLYAPIVGIAPSFISVLKPLVPAHQDGNSEVTVYLMQPAFDASGVHTRAF
jgi:uncharacterized membrane protein required for colicin V production